MTSFQWFLLWNSFKEIQAVISGFLMGSFLPKIPLGACAAHPLAEGKEIITMHIYRNVGGRIKRNGTENENPKLRQ